MSSEYILYSVYMVDVYIIIGLLRTTVYNVQIYIL